MSEPARLDEFDKAEWWDVCRRVKPDLTEEEYDRMWDSFQAEKAERQRARSLH